MASRQYPRFLFSDPQNVKTVGPFIVHTMFPRAIFKVITLDQRPSLQLLEITDECSQDEERELSASALKWLISQISEKTINLSTLSEGKSEAAGPFAKHNKNIQQILEFFKKYDFKETVDNIGSYYTGNKLYYKDLRNHMFIVFNHFNEKDRNRDGFDCHLSLYKSENEIGDKKPYQSYILKMGFNFDRDYRRIEAFMEK